MTKDVFDDAVTTEVEAEVHRVGSWPGDAPFLQATFCSVGRCECGRPMIVFRAVDGAPFAGLHFEVDQLTTFLRKSVNTLTQ